MAISATPPEGDYYPWQLSLTVVEHFLGTMRYRAIFLPPDVAALSEFAGARVRFEGELNEHAVSLAWQSAREGRKYAMLSPTLLKTIGAGVGDTVDMRFRLVAPDIVEAPAELTSAIETDEAALARWNGLSPGRQRGLSALVASAKKLETRVKRAGELAALLGSGGELPGPPGRSGKPKGIG